MGESSDTMELQGGSGAAGGGDEEGDLAPISHHAVYETKYQKSLRHYLTREALPNESNYRNLESIVDGSNRQQRLTLDELHDSTYHEEVSKNMAIKILIYIHLILIYVYIYI